MLQIKLSFLDGPQIQAIDFLERKLMHVALLQEESAHARYIELRNLIGDGNL
jgi:hypothetical protein